MILIVDDVDEVGSISSEYLMRRVPNVEAFETTRPTEALAWLRTAPRVDLILSDHHMGEMDGVTFLRQARDLRPQATRALMTAYLDLPLPPGDLARRGIHALVKKPWQWADFALFVVDLLSLTSADRARLAAGAPLQFPEGTFADSRAGARGAGRA